MVDHKTGPKRGFQYRFIDGNIYTYKGSQAKEGIGDIEFILVTGEEYGGSPLTLRFGINEWGSLIEGEKIIPWEDNLNGPPEVSQDIVVPPPSKERLYDSKDGGFKRVYIGEEEVGDVGMCFKFTSLDGKNHLWVRKAGWDEEVLQHRTVDIGPATGAGAGRKFCDGKPRWGLVPLSAMKEIVNVLTYGSKKYADDNWKYVPNAVSKYKDALGRHLEAAFNQDDPHTFDDGKDGSGLYHLAHAGCCILFLLWFTLNPGKEVKE